MAFSEEKINNKINKLLYATRNIEHCYLFEGQFVARNLTNP